MHYTILNHNTLVILSYTTLVKSNSKLLSMLAFNIKLFYLDIVYKLVGFY